MSHNYRPFDYAKGKHLLMHDALTPVVLAQAQPLSPEMRVLDVGCGNGDLAGVFLDRGCQVTGIDLSDQGIALAREAHPAGRFEVQNAEGDLLAELDESPFDLVVSTEVVEHLYSPRDWARACHAALKPGGKLICSTPYHGYVKNLALSVAGHWDKHANPLWDGGHIKLWSKNTLTQLLEEIGFKVTAFKGVGRLPWLWMTMVIVAEKPLPIPPQGTS